MAHGHRLNRSDLDNELHVLTFVNKYELGSIGSDGILREAVERDAQRMLRYIIRRCAQQTLDDHNGVEVYKLRLDCIVFNRGDFETRLAEAYAQGQKDATYFPTIPHTRFEP